MNPNANANALFPVNPSDDGLPSDFEFDFLQVDPDDNASAAISQWELVNPSDADDSDDPSDFDYDCYFDHDVMAGSMVAVPFAPLDEDSSDGNSPPLIDQYSSGGTNPDPSAEAEVHGSFFVGNVAVAVAGDGFEYRNKYDYAEEEEEEEEKEYDDGLDDELVPRHMRGKLGRERIRKLGKRGCSKMSTSKKSPFLYMKRGCLHGKHGFGIGLKNSL